MEKLVIVKKGVSVSGLENYTQVELMESAINLLKEDYEMGFNPGRVNAYVEHKYLNASYANDEIFDFINGVFYLKLPLFKKVTYINEVVFETYESKSLSNY